MKIRLTRPEYSKFNGSFGAVRFIDGVSAIDLTPAQVARVACTTACVDADTDEPVGPSHNLLRMDRGMTVPVLPQHQRLDEVKRQELATKEQLIAKVAERAEQDKAALEAANLKAEAAIDDIVIYSRMELEAMAANEGIGRLREIGKPLGAKGRSISELISEILSAQTQQAIV